MLHVRIDGADEIAVTALGVMVTVQSRRPMLASCSVWLSWQVDDAAIEKELDMSSKLRELLNHKVLLVH